MGGFVGGVGGVGGVGRMASGRLHGTVQRFPQSWQCAAVV
jgi:hypothetical protein